MNRQDKLIILIIISSIVMAASIIISLYSIFIFKNIITLPVIFVLFPLSAIILYFSAHVYPKYKKWVKAMKSKYNNDFDEKEHYFPPFFRSKTAIDLGEYRYKAFNISVHERGLKTYLTYGTNELLPFREPLLFKSIEEIIVVDKDNVIELKLLTTDLKNWKVITSKKNDLEELIDHIKRAGNISIKNQRE